MNSPGFCAKYCTYLGIDEQTEGIVAMEIEDKRKVDFKCTSMEGFIWLIKSLENANVRVKEVKTDAHRGNMANGRVISWGISMGI